MISIRPAEWRGISRVDHKHTHGWLARVYLSRKRTIAKLFSDKKLGGREAALEQARLWRQNYPIADEDRPNLVPPKFLRTLPKNNTTGRIGVSRGVKRSRNGKLLRCFQVCWVPERCHPKNKTFYVHQYESEEKTFEAACEFRTQMERELEQLEAKDRRNVDRSAL